MGEPKIPEKPTLDGLEPRWEQQWQADGTYRFDRSRERADVYSIDTPPPTVSGSLHVGHVFSFTHTDTMARYMRMQGKSVFYPMGWDDNGLATERRVENYYGVRCDPSVGFEPDFEPPEKAAKERRDFIPVSRRNFAQLCERLTEIDEKAFEDTWRLLGLSVDWTLKYTTVSERSQRISQRAFLRNLARGEAYSAEAPSLWDTTFQTAVAQAELEDRERPGAYHDLAFHKPDGSDLVISTTRPELVVSCVALVAHPDDERYQPLFGSTVTTPAYGVEVPVLAHPLAEPDKGTGVAMICTFGDTTDVTWWRELDLPARAVIGKDGRFAVERTAVAHHRRGPGALRPHRRQGRRRRPQRHGRAAGRDRRAARRPAADHPSGQVLREGRPAARDRHQPPVVHPQRRPRRRPATDARRARRRGRLAARVHAAPLRQLGRGPQRRLAGLPAALLGRPVPHLVPARRRGPPRLRRSDRPVGGRPADRPVVARPARLHRRPAGQAQRVRRRPRHHGHVGHLVAHADDRLRLGGGPRPLRPHLSDGPAAAGPRHHPHLAVLDRSSAATTSATRSRGATPPCRGGSSTPTARRCRSRRATSSRPSTCSTSTAPTPSATGRRAADPAPTPRSTPDR